MATEVVCDYSDLPADQCAHCTGATLDEDLGNAPLADEGSLCEARFAGTCKHCHQRYPEGEEIAHTEIGWVHVYCSRQAGTGRC